MSTRKSWARGCNVVALAGLIALAASAPSGAAPAPAAEKAASAEGLADLSLEQLREVVVTTVSRSAERLDRVAASVYVISGDDIRRSGATTIPEALRLAPTLDVAVPTRTSTRSARAASTTSWPTRCWG